MAIRYEQTIAPAAEPVTLAEVKDHAKIETADEDAYITALIAAARQMIVLRTGRALITETWTATLDAWPRGAVGEWWGGTREMPITTVEATSIELDKVPFGNVSKVEVLDESNVATEWASSNYYTARQFGRGLLVRKSGVVWPTVLRDVAGIVITFTIGYGADGNAVPLPLRHAIKMLVAHWYDNRTPASACASSDLMPAGLGEIIGQFRVMR